MVIARKDTLLNWTSSASKVMKTLNAEIARLRKEVEILEKSNDFYKDNNKIRATKDKHLNFMALKAQQKLKELRSKDA